MTGDIRIGFPFSLSGGGPSIFLKRLRKSIAMQKLARPTFFIDPFSDINIYANVTRNPWRKPYVMRVDGIYFDKARSEAERNTLNKPIFWGFDNARGVVFQSSFDAKLIASVHGAPKVPHEIIPNGVDLEEFSPRGQDMRGLLGATQDELIFLASAKWRAHKRLDSIINVFLAFKKTHDQPCRLLILGHIDHPLSVDDPSIQIVGHVSPDKLAPWYRTADVFLFFSWLDHCPNTVVEALACGLPVVCTNQGGTRELIKLTGGGEVAEADAPFPFEPVALYSPPEPDLVTLLEAVERVVARRDEYAHAIDRKPIDINVVARRYVAFMHKVYRG